MRLALGAEARWLGHGGIELVARASGVSRKTISAGAAELKAGGEPLEERIRREGGGRKPLAETDPGLVEALDALVEPETRGDPMTRRGQRLAGALFTLGLAAHSKRSISPSSSRMPAICPDRTAPWLDLGPHPLSGKPRASVAVLDVSSDLALLSVCVRPCMHSPALVVTQLVTQVRCRRDADRLFAKLARSSRDSA